MSEPSLQIKRLMNARREVVFKAWTDPAILAKWWGPDGVTNPTCVWQAEPGGEINIVMLAGEELGELSGQEWPMRGRFDEVVEPEKLVFTSQAIMDGRPVLENRCTVLLEEQGDQTQMTISVVVTKTTPEAAGPLQGMEMGWNQQTDKLVKLVESLS